MVRTPSGRCRGKTPGWPPATTGTAARSWWLWRWSLQHTAEGRRCRQKAPGDLPACRLIRGCSGTIREASQQSTQSLPACWKVPRRCQQAGVASAPVEQLSRPSRTVELTFAVAVHGNRALYFFSASARRAAAIAPALHTFAMLVSCCGMERYWISGTLQGGCRC